MFIITLHFPSINDLDGFAVANEDQMYATITDPHTLTANVLFEEEADYNAYKAGLSSDFFNITSWE